MNNTIRLNVGEEIVSAVLVDNVYIYCVSNMGNFYVRDVRGDFMQPVVETPQPQVNNEQEKPEEQKPLEGEVV